MATKSFRYSSKIRFRRSELRIAYTFFSGAEPDGFTEPFNFNTYLLRPTGNADEYSILFDSGTLEGRLQ